MADIAAQPLDGRNFNTRTAQFGHGRQLFINRRCSVADSQFGKKRTFVTAVKLAFDIAARKQPAAEQYHHDCPGNRGDQAIRRDFEDAEAGQPLIARNRIDDQVGRGTDQRGRTTQYADEAQRDEQFLG